MSQSLSDIQIHLVFSTKHRAPMLSDSVREELHAYMVGVLKNLTSPVIALNSVTDHVHVLFSLGRTVSVAKVVEDLKKSSSKWLKTKGGGLEEFAWQAGYGAFSVSRSSVEAVIEYIRTQDVRHKNLSFQDELRGILSRHNIDFEEDYLWD